MSAPELSKKLPRKRLPRFALLDGSPPAKARGRHAGHPIDTGREVVVIPVNRRLGFRPQEYSALTGISLPHTWRGIRSGEIETVLVNGIKVVPRAFVIK